MMLHREKMHLDEKEPATRGKTNSMRNRNKRRNNRTNSGAITLEFITSPTSTLSQEVGHAKNLEGFIEKFINIEKLRLGSD